MSKRFKKDKRKAVFCSINYSNRRKFKSITKDNGYTIRDVPYECFNGIRKISVKDLKHRCKNTLHPDLIIHNLLKELYKDEHRLIGAMNKQAADIWEELTAGGKLTIYRVIDE